MAESKKSIFRPTRPRKYSGVVNNIPDNCQVMGYPAVPLKEFVKQRKK